MQPLGGPTLRPWALDRTYQPVYCWESDGYVAAACVFGRELPLRP